MKILGHLFYMTIIVLLASSCKKNDSPFQPKTLSTWSFKGSIDTGMAVSVQDNIDFKYAVNGQTKSITFKFYSAIKQNRSFYPSDMLTDSTKCLVKVDEGNGQVYSSYGPQPVMINATLANYTIKFDFSNVMVISKTDTQSVSGSLAFPSFY